MSTPQAGTILTKATNPDSEAAMVFSSEMDYQPAKQALADVRLYHEASTLKACRQGTTHIPIHYIHFRCRGLDRVWKYAP